LKQSKRIGDKGRNSTHKQIGKGQGKRMKKQKQKKKQANITVLGVGGGNMNKEGVVKRCIG